MQMVKITTTLAITFALAFAPQARAQQADPVVLLETTRGPIAIRVFRHIVPGTANNFLDLVDRGFYNGKIFHRVEGWLIQGGCPFGNGRGNYVDPDTGQVRYIPLETTPRLGHGQPGMVAMARGQNPNSASCQFYILKQAKPALNNQYAVFGMVVGGLQNVYNIGIGDRIVSARISESRQPSARPASDSTGENTNNNSGGDSGKSSSGESGF